MIATPAPTLVLPVTLQTVDEFEQWQQQYAHEGSYEFVRGRIIEKKEMKQAEYLILKFLTRLFTSTTAYKRGDELRLEMDSYVDDTRKRRPDLAYFKLEQIEQTRQGIRQKTRFAIEILSDSETHQNVLDKIQDYFDGEPNYFGTSCPERVFPNSRKYMFILHPTSQKRTKGRKSFRRLRS